MTTKVTPFTKTELTLMTIATAIVTALVLGIYAQQHYQNGFRRAQMVVKEATYLSCLTVEKLAPVESIGATATEKHVNAFLHIAATHSIYPGAQGLQFVQSQVLAGAGAFRFTLNTDIAQTLGWGSEWQSWVVDAINRQDLVYNDSKTRSDGKYSCAEVLAGL